MILYIFYNFRFRFLKLLGCQNDLYSKRIQSERYVQAMKQIVYERLIQYILENQDGF